MPGILQYLRSFRHLARTAESDGELLRRFRMQRDEQAFTLLVQRHGAMVFSIASHVLGSSAAAEDAFQATFLVLARKGKQMETWPSVAGWLVQVARRTAFQARARSSRRSRHEKRAAAMTSPAAAADPMRLASQHDLAELLDAELARLPSKYRLPLILCQLQGQTREETARQLGWPVGSVSGRLARGKKLLQDRLLRRGIAPSLAASAIALPRLDAHVPPLLVQAATLLAAHTLHQTSTVSSASAAAALAQGVMISMWMTKLKYVAASLALLGACAGAGAWAFSHAGKPAPTQTQGSSIQAIDPLPHNQQKQPALQELRQLRLKLAQERMDMWLQAQNRGLPQGSFDELGAVSQQLLDARLPLATDIAGKLEAMEEHLKALKRIEEIAEMQFKSGSRTKSDLLSKQLQRVEFEIQLEELKGKR